MTYLNYILVAFACSGLYLGVALPVAILIGRRFRQMYVEVEGDLWPAELV